MNGKNKEAARARRARRTRVVMHGTQQKPRMSVSRSLKHIYVQLINDDQGTTIASASDFELKTQAKPTDLAREVGKLIGEKAKAAGVQTVVFDRGAFRYHGRVAAVAEGAREVGLTF